MKTKGDGKILKILERMAMARMESNILYRGFIELNAGKPVEGRKEDAQEAKEASCHESPPDVRREGEATALPSAEAFVP